MTTLIHQRVELARAGANPTVICRMPSGWAVLGDNQYLRGYTILLADPVVPDLNALGKQQRTQFLLDMTVIGDALLQVTGAFRINYGIMGNLDPALHAHIVPRYLTEPDELRQGPPWSYPRAVQQSIPFDLDRDLALMAQIAEAISGLS